MLKRIFFFVPSVFAQNATSNSSAGLGCGGGLGPIAEFLCQGATGERVGTKLNTVLSALVGFLTTIAGLWMIFQLITAGYQWINAGGDKTNLEAARNKIYHSLVGLIVVVVAWVVIALIGKMLGLDILDPGKIIQTIGM